MTKRSKRKRRRYAPVAKKEVTDEPLLSMVTSTSGYYVTSEAVDDELKENNRSDMNSLDNSPSSTTSSKKMDMSEHVPSMATVHPLRSSLDCFLQIPNQEVCATPTMSVDVSHDSSATVTVQSSCTSDACVTSTTDVQESPILHKALERRKKKREDSVSSVDVSSSSGQANGKSNAKEGRGGSSELEDEEQCFDVQPSEVIISQDVSVGSCETEGASSVERPEGSSDVEATAEPKTEGASSVERPEGSSDVEATAEPKTEGASSVERPEGSSDVEATAEPKTEGASSVERPEGSSDVEATAEPKTEGASSVERPEGSSDVEATAKSQTKLPGSFEELLIMHFERKINVAEMVESMSCLERDNQTTEAELAQLMGQVDLLRDVNQQLDDFTFK